MKLILSAFLLLSQFVFAQNYADSIQTWVTKYHLQPISNLDTTSPNIPKNFITDSGWHVEFYGEYENGYLTNEGKQAFRGIKMSNYIYKDNYCFIYMDDGWFNIDKIIYDSLFYFKETQALLCFKTRNDFDSSETIIVFPKKVDTVGYFIIDKMIYADYDNGIFIELDYSCRNPVALALKAINVFTAESIDVVFTKKAFCDDKSGVNCLRNVYYVNGILTIEAVLKNKRTKKEFIEIKKIKI